MNPNSDSNTPRPLRILSFGAGVQSSAVARMSIIGELPPFDHVIFADTGDEPESVYINMKWWEKRFTDEGVAFHQVGRETSISDDLRAVASGEKTRSSNPPLFTKNDDGSTGIIRRTCTSDYKIEPIMRLIRDITGLYKKRHMHITETLVEQTMGISWDEVQRMKSHPYPWVENVYPLVDRRITRYDCIAAMKADDTFPDPVRSACWHCPFHSNEEWRYLRNEEPESFQKAIDLDLALRANGQFGKITKPVYLHNSGKPLGEINFDNAEDAGQGTLWGDECAGVCGV